MVKCQFDELFPRCTSLQKFSSLYAVEHIVCLYTVSTILAFTPTGMGWALSALDDIVILVDMNVEKIQLFDYWLLKFLFKLRRNFKYGSGFIIVIKVNSAMDGGQSIPPHNVTISVIKFTLQKNEKLF